MPIERDLSDLPAAPKEEVNGWPPDAHPRFGPILATHWHAEADDDIPNAVEGARFRHSDAGACSRYLAYAALGLPVSNPMDLAGHFITTQGQMIHKAWQDILAAHFPGAQVELSVGEGEMGGHIDGVVVYQDDDDQSVIASIEGKSVDGFAYKLAVGERGPAQGPKYDHVIQASLNALAAKADEAVIVYWARGAISVQAAKRKPSIDLMRRVVAEWTLPREQFEPIARKEIERVTTILGMVDDGILPARKIPDPELPARHVITDPRVGQWVVLDPTTQKLVDTGTTWQCYYCRYQDLCVKTGPGRDSVDVVKDL